MVTLTTRPYIGEKDLETIAHLINTCEAIDHLNEGISVLELQQKLNNPTLDKERDLCLWEDGNSQLVGYAEIHISQSGKEVEGFLWFRAHPAVRGSDLETQIVAWGEERLREFSQERSVTVKLRSAARADQFSKIKLLESCNFVPERYFFRMSRSLSLPIPEPQLPQGFTLHQGGQNNVEAWVEMYNQSFIDHWNYHQLTVERVKHEKNKSNHNSELDLVAVAPDETYATFCYCQIHPEENVRSGRNEGWIVCIGTRRGFRRLGLARAMLLTGMQRLKAAGVETALLGVDAQNPSGAGQLYESVGFHQCYTSISYVKDVLL